ncbi:uncharacterized protein LOC121753269 isoform X2 [Salvia splendens]|uniref:uncharacterized protein LOC121753269 isoform X2 n=1 Tax=Salvia splendens TaxID=180675 RepID=UPI001C25EAE7|nr:uncharacterized protein LOC121753269 isoform X2 [Salvia splendens]
MQQKVTIPNKHGKKLVGLLHDTGSPQLVVLCHGFRSTKEYKIMVNLAGALEKEGISAFRFDFSGNGESEGSFQFGGDVVLLYASKYHDIPAVVNLSGRYDLKRGIEERFGKDFMERLKKDGYMDVKTKKGEVEYRVTEESMKERLNTNMHGACLLIDPSCRLLTVHGSADEIIPLEDAKEFAKILPNHELKIIEGANHGYSSHQDELVSVVLPFLKEMCATR